MLLTILGAVFLGWFCSRFFGAIGYWAGPLFLAIMALQAVGRLLRLFWQWQLTIWGLSITGTTIVVIIVVLVKTHDRWGAKCAICGQVLHIGQTLHLKDGHICATCAGKVGLKPDSIGNKAASILTVDHVKASQQAGRTIDAAEFWQHHQTRIKEREEARTAEYHQLKTYFKQHHTARYGSLYFDDQSKRLFFDETLKNIIYKYVYRVYDYRDLIDYQVKQHNVDIIEHNKVVGTFVNGGYYPGYENDSVTPTVSEYKVVLYFSQEREETITLVDGQLKKDSLRWAWAQRRMKKLCASFDHVIDIANHDLAAENAKHVHYYHKNFKITSGPR